MDVEKHNTRPSLHTRYPLGLLLFAATLLSVLLAQIIWIEREAFAKRAVWRPVISQFCLVAGCQLSAWRQPEAFVIVQQSIQADPEQAGGLLVQVSFRNTAPWPQPWPSIELAFTDITGHTTAMRRFHPKDYLNQDHLPDIKANQSVFVEMALQESNNQAVDFHFNFF
jgi:hypothetical protein